MSKKKTKIKTKKTEAIDMINAFAKGFTLLAAIPYVVLFLIWLVLQLYGFLHWFPLFSVDEVEYSYEWYCANYVDESWSYKKARSWGCRRASRSSC